jgi:ATP-dependent helicase HrpA
LAALQQTLGRTVQKELARATARQSRSGSTWVFDELPVEVRLRRGDVGAPAYPALQDARTAVRETFAATLSQARRTHRQGLVRLIALALPDPSKGVLAHLGAEELAALAASPYTSVAALLADARDAAIATALGRHGDPWQIRDRPAFDAAVAAVRPEQVPVMQRVTQTAALALIRLGTVETSLARYPSDSPLAHDVSGQLDDLVFDGFVHVISDPWLDRLPVWLDGVARRLEAAFASPVRDDQRLAELAPVQTAYATLVERHPGPSEEIDRLGFLIEELRLQLFAQPVRTVQPVSVKRLLKAIAEFHEAD